MKTHMLTLGRLMLPGAALAGLLLLLGCDDGPPADKAEAKAEEKKAEAPTKTAPVAGGPKKPIKLAKAEMDLKENDFIESHNNRDPFHSFILRVSSGSRRGSRQRKVVLKRYALDELKLIAVVTGQARPRAMFRDPKGLGVTVKRGDYISKSEGKVKQILSDKVIVEIEASAENRRSRSDTVIPLHTKGASSL